jgi:hypothetical protein
MKDYNPVLFNKKKAYKATIIFQGQDINFKIKQKLRKKKFKKLLNEYIFKYKKPI